MLERFADELQREFGDRLESVWLYGSRARGEEPRPESDVDLLLILRDATSDDDMPIHKLMYDLVQAEGGEPFFFSLVET